MQSPESIELRPVVPRADVAYRRFIIAALVLAVAAGFLLAIHVPLSRLMDAGRPERTADLVQAHGQVQLLGFAGLYVIGMSLRLLPRFAGARLQMEALVPVVLWLMVVSLVTRAAVLPWFYGDAHDALLILSVFGVLIAAACFLLLVAATLGTDARHVDASGIAFLLGALSLFAANLVATFAAVDAVAAGDRFIPYAANAAVTQLQLLGFLLVFITGVGLRALPLLVGRQQPERGAAILPAAIVALVSVHAASLLYLAYVSPGRSVSMLADASLALLGLCLLLFVWQAGILRPRANRTRPASQSALWLVRGAFFWLTVAGCLMVYFGGAAFADRQLFSQSELDAVRHVLGAGVITNLVLGMSLLILPEFAAERQQANRQRLLALSLAVLVNLAALLRVGPSVATDALSYDDRNLSMAIAGSLAETALLVFAVYFVRLLWRTRVS